MGFLRRLLDDLLRLFARVTLHVFFREVEVKGLDNLKQVDGAMLLVANHVNNLIDPFLLLGFVGRRPRFLAKSTLWSHPVVAPLLLLMGALPVYRRQDGARVSRNIQTFARCRAILGQGGTVSLFPEGRSHNEPGPQPLKTGAARIALETAARHPEVRLKIVPVGLIYEDKERFRSRVLLHVGTPIDPALEVAEHRDPGGAAVRQLTRRIAAGLEAVTVRFASWEEARLVDRAAFLAAEADVRLSDRLPLWQCLASAYQRLLVEDPIRARRLLGELRSWDAADAAGAPRRARLRRTVLFFVPGALGVLLNWLPFKLPGWIANAVTRTPDEPATYKLIAALVTLPLAWLLEAAVVARFFGPLWGLAALLLAPLLGYMALLLRDAIGFSEPSRPPRDAPPFPAEERRALRDEIRALCLHELSPQIMGAEPRAAAPSPSRLLRPGSPP
jgi:glycerol-3-phosphate O-acyltransferase / dihydroxyacetone phosphate acyltransferase